MKPMDAKATVSSLVFLVAVVCSVSGATNEGEASAARLLVSKKVQNRYLVQGMDVVIHYGLYNVGDSAATDVVLTEAGFSPNDFDVAAGQPVVKFLRIPPRANNSHVLVLRPKTYGQFNFTAAEVRYRTAGDGGDDDDDGNNHDEVVKVGYSSHPGQALIISLKDYEKQFSAHMLDWVAFAIMTLPSLGIPFLLWNSSRSKYENMKVKE